MGVLGTPDVTFSDDGWQTISMSGYYETGTKVLMQGTRPVLAGYSEDGPFNDSFVASGVASRFYEITVTPQNAGTNSLYNASLRLYYSDADIQGINENSLKLVRLTNDGWIYVGGTVNTSENYVEANNIHEVGLFAFADPDSITNVDSDVEGLVNEFKLEQNHPNPFNPTTTIRFSLPQATQLKINIYSIIGEQVATIAEGTYEAGYHKVTFNEKNLPSGTYIYRLESNDFIQVKKMILIK